jgi:hypothetical protein
VTEFEWQRGAAATSVKEANTRVILEQEGEAFDMHALLEQAPSVDMSDAPVYVSPPRQDASSHEEAEEDAEALSHEPVVPQVAPSDNGDTPGSPSAMRSQAQGSVMHTHEMHAGKAQGRTASSASKASQGSATTTVRPALAAVSVTPLPAACSACWRARQLAQTRVGLDTQYAGTWRRRSR